LFFRSHTIQKVLIDSISIGLYWKSAKVIAENITLWTFARLSPSTSKLKISGPSNCRLCFLLKLWFIPCILHLIERFHKSISHSCWLRTRWHWDNHFMSKCIRWSLSWLIKWKFISYSPFLIKPSIVNKLIIITQIFFENLKIKHIFIRIGSLAHLLLMIFSRNPRMINIAFVVWWWIIFIVTFTNIANWVLMWYLRYIITIIYVIVLVI